jgi:hypothetical protein
VGVDLIVATAVTAGIASILYFVRTLSTRRSLVIWVTLLAGAALGVLEYQRNRIIRTLPSPELAEIANSTKKIEELLESHERNPSAAVMSAPTCTDETLHPEEQNGRSVCVNYLAHRSEALRSELPKPKISTTRCDSELLHPEEQNWKIVCVDYLGFEPEEFTIVIPSKAKTP